MSKGGGVGAGSVLAKPILRNKVLVVDFIA